jgi:hypothetical protein
VKRQNRLERVRAIERELRAAEFAVGLLADTLRKNSGLLSAREFGIPDVRKLERNLEGTYLIRMFAEFEAGLRDAWANFFGRDSHPRVSDLIDAIAGYQFVPDDVTDGVHGARRFRNGLVHEGGEAAVPVAFDAARSVLGLFLSRLPLDW